MPKNSGFYSNFNGAIIKILQNSIMGKWLFSSVLVHSMPVIYSSKVRTIENVFHQEQVKLRVFCNISVHSRSFQQLLRNHYFLYSPQSFFPSPFGDLFLISTLGREGRRNISLFVYKSLEMSINVCKLYANLCVSLILPLRFSPPLFLGKNATIRIHKITRVNIRPV